VRERREIVSGGNLEIAGEEKVRGVEYGGEGDADENDSAVL
jgi:hypothetical protein